VLLHGKDRFRVRPGSLLFRREVSPAEGPHPLAPLSRSGWGTEGTRGRGGGGEGGRRPTLTGPCPGGTLLSADDPASVRISGVDEKRSGYDLKAPGDASSPHLPGRGDFPRVDDHLVVPEVTRDEIIKGRRVVAEPADAPHGDQHFRLDYVVGALVAPGYQVSTDLLTRMGRESDFASDSSIRKAGDDPATGSRYLEEIVFEVVSTQSEEEDVTEKAEERQARGVRRIFAIFVKEPRRVCEWSPENRRWMPLDAGAQIEDPCLVTPLDVAALFDTALADNAVVKALMAKRHPGILKLEEAAEGRAEGKVKGTAEAILKVLEARGVAVSQAQREEILRCSDLARLSRWVVRASLATSAEEVTAEP
jgi:hypothetical protein